MAEILTTKSTFIDYFYPNTNYGTNVNLAINNVLRASILYQDRALLHFDVSTLTAPSKRYLRLYCNYVGNGIEDITIRRLTQLGWTETGATWNKYDGVNNWTLAGGDSTATGAITLINPTETGWVEVDISSLVDDAILNRSNNLDIILVRTYENGVIQSQFYSDDHADNAYHPRLTEYQLKPFTADTIASITETLVVLKKAFDDSITNNTIAYVMNKNKGFSKVTVAPYTSMIYRPSLNQIWATRRDKAQISIVNLGTNFDETAINSTLQTGYMDFGEFDEVQVMQGKMADAIKIIRALHSEVKSDGNLTLTVYTENDSTGKSFTITPGTSDNVVYNMVRTALSRDIKGKFLSFKLVNASGEDFYIGKMALRLIPKGLK